MITPASSAGSPGAIPPPTSPRPASFGPSSPQADYLDIQPGRLEAALDRTPAVRPDVIARGAQLALDPNYPSDEIINQVADMIVNSPDLSESSD